MHVRLDNPNIDEEKDCSNFKAFCRLQKPLDVFFLSNHQRKKNMKKIATIIIAITVLLLAVDDMAIHQKLRQVQSDYTYLVVQMYHVNAWDIDEAKNVIADHARRNWKKHNTNTNTVALTNK